MRYGIVVDSGCDLINLGASNIDFTRVPLKLDIGNKEFVDDFDLNIEAFMQEMYEYKGKTGSAAPSPQTWLDAYEKSEYVFAITITSGLSGSYSSAVNAAEMFKENYPDRKIHVIDSKSAGPSLTLIAKKLAELIQQGLDFETICAQIDTYACSGTELLFVLQSLDNLIKNGRVSKLAGTVAGLLGIKMLGAASTEGKLELLKKCRGKMTAYTELVEEMLRRKYKGGKVIISHAFAPELGDYISSAIKSHFPDCHIEIMPASGLCTYYAEKGGILVGYEI